MAKVNPRTKPPAFQFYPRNLLTSTAYTSMTPEERGGYFSLFCHGWLQNRPGWLRDDDRLLAALSGLGRRWPACRAGIAAAYRVRRGWWVDVWMVLERRGQRRKSLRRAAAGHRGGKQKASNSVAKASSSSSIASASAFKKLRLTPLVADATGSGGGDLPEQTSVVGVGEELPRQWAEGFQEFWKDYPRKVKREEALKAYAKLRPRTQETYDLLFAGLDHWRNGEWAGRTPDKIEHCSTWLNNRRFMDAKAEQ